MSVNNGAVLKQYQSLIRALIPYEQENRLLEGLNRFSGRLPSHIRRLVRDEVIRLTSLTDAPADNSAFAQFPVFKFKHFGVDMRLDKVGAQILKKESSLYQERYTVGVFESLTNSAFYQAHIKEAQHKKIVDAFSVQQQSQTDIDFGNDIALAPNFQLASPDFEKGRHCVVSSLAFNRLSLETKRPPKAQNGEKYTFAMPEVFGQYAKHGAMTYRLQEITFNKQTERYESHFVLEAEQNKKQQQQLQRYIKGARYQQPLQRELELERAMQDLERDRVLLHSAWTPLLIDTIAGIPRPVAALLTMENNRQNQHRTALQALSGKDHFARLFQELDAYGEAFVLTGTITTRRGQLDIVSTHRQLLALNQFTPLYYVLSKADNFSCIQCRMAGVSKQNRQTAYAIHDINADEQQVLSHASHLIYYTDITHRLGAVSLTKPCQLGPVHKECLAESHCWPVQLIMDNDLERRQEDRYALNKPATVKTGLLSTLNAQVADISARGIRLIFTVPPDTTAGIVMKVSVPALKIKSEKYQLIDFCRDTLTGRFRHTGKRSPAALIHQAVEASQAYYRARNLNLQSRQRHHFVWELAVRAHPCAAVLCINNRYLLDRLKTLYQPDSCTDLYPFAVENNIAPLHGFLADRDADKPRSALLTALFNNQIDNTGIVHCVRNADSKLVYVSEQDFLYKAIRANISAHLAEDKTQLCVTRMQMSLCRSEPTVLSRKRLAQLSKVDKSLYEKLLAMQQGYTNVLYLSSESSIHTALVRAGLKPVVPVNHQQSGRARHSA